jgi:hypothetical protein
VTAAAFAVALALLLLAARIALARTRAPRLPAAEGEPPRVAVLLPVRDEEENIEACLSALLAQTAPVEVLVLDDGSHDRTRELASRIAAADSRVRVLAVPAPPPGASGKVNALAFGLAELQETERLSVHWVLSIDADARPGREAIARALAAAEQNGLAAISLAARQRVASLGESLLTPLVFALLDLLLGDWRAAAAGAGTAVANGQFFLFNRTSLLLAGGFAAIAGAPLDDVAMARLLAARGLRVGFWRAREVLEVRMYAGFAASLSGWRRNLALILGNRRALVAAVSALALAPAGAAATALLVGAPGAACIAWAGGAAASALARAGTGSSPLFGLLYPLDALALTRCLAAAARDRARGRLAPWRGRALAPGDEGTVRVSAAAGAPSSDSTGRPPR